MNWLAPAAVISSSNKGAEPDYVPRGPQQRDNLQLRWPHTGDPTSQCNFLCPGQSHQHRSGIWAALCKRGCEVLCRRSATGRRIENYCSAPARRLAAFVLGRELGHRLAGGNRVFPHMVVEIGRQFAM